MRRLATAAAVAFVLAACGSDDDPATTEARSGTDAPPATADPPATDAPPATDPPTTDAGLAEAAGLAAVELVDPPGGEPQPLLTWAPVDGAATYRLAVVAADGRPYWAWTGGETEVRFGGAPDGGGQTAVLTEPMSWSVAAVDAAGEVIAISETGQLTP